MPDIVTEVILPSNGKLYSPEVAWRNQLRAPRLRDSGFGDTTRKLKLQASILDKTLIQPLGMSTYDLHTADFVYLNYVQRKLSKGGLPYRVAIKCPFCGEEFNVDVPLEELEIKQLEEAPHLTYKTLEDKELVLTYITPRMLDESIVRAADFKSTYKETELDDGALRTQELLRFVIRSVDGRVLTEPQMTQFIQDLYKDDIDDIFNTVNDFDFGLQTLKEVECKNRRCQKKVKYRVPVG